MLRLRLLHPLVRRPRRPSMNQPFLGIVGPSEGEITKNVREQALPPPTYDHDATTRACGLLVLERLCRSRQQTGLALCDPRAQTATIASQLSSFRKCSPDGSAC